MLQALINIFKIPELRNKILFTLGMLAVYRIGFWVPLPGVDQSVMADYFASLGENNPAGKVIQYVAVFTGGTFSQSTIFGLGIMPYISAAIIFQLLGSVWPRLKQLREEGPTGQQKIQEWTRFATVGLCIVQAVAFLQYITGTGGGLVYAGYASNPVWWAMAITALTAGTIFLMWLGEQIDKYGIGNGVSLIIMAGILSGMPNAVLWVVNNFEPGNPDKMGFAGLFFLIGGFVLIVAGSVLMTVAQRRIPIQAAKHTRGRKVVGGQRSYLPLRVNHGGVMPIIFASSLMIFPSVLFGMLEQQINVDGSGGFLGTSLKWLSDQFQMGELPYNLVYILMVFIFSYFWITVQFNPDEMSKQLRDHGSFIPGLRPGPRTAEYLETVMERVTYVGAAFLAVIAIAPMVVNKAMGVDFSVTQFLGGTGLLIVVSVGLDFIQRIEAHLLMRNYAGFLGGSDQGGQRRIRGASG